MLASAKSIKLVDRQHPDALHATGTEAGRRRGLGRSRRTARRAPAAPSGWHRSPRGRRIRDRPWPAPPRSASSSDSSGSSGSDVTDRLASRCACWVSGELGLGLAGVLALHPRDDGEHGHQRRHEPGDEQLPGAAPGAVLGAASVRRSSSSRACASARGRRRWRRGTRVPPGVAPSSSSRPTPRWRRAGLRAAGSPATGRRRSTSASRRRGGGGRAGRRGRRRSTRAGSSTRSAAPRGRSRRSGHG